MTRALASDIAEALALLALLTGIACLCIAAEPQQPHSDHRVMMARMK